MDIDFLIFQLRVFSSLTPNVPLQQNLRAVMAPALHKLARSCRGQVAIHLFVNQEVQEVHAMVLGSAKETLAAVREEEERRHGGLEDLIPRPGLPEYFRLSWRNDDPRDQLFPDLNAFPDERLLTPIGNTSPLWYILRDLYRERRKEFRFSPEEDDSLLVLRLPSKEYPRLGYFLVWSPKTDERFLPTCDEPRRQEARVEFRRSMARLLIRLFANFYDMKPETYLPSYCRPETKNVTLLAARLRGFDAVSACVSRRKDLTPQAQANCISDLIRRFNEIFATLVRQNHGRVDQLCGDAVLAVFGEYLDTVDETPRPGCKYALSAAAALVGEFQESVKEWLDKVFRLNDYRKQGGALHVSVSVAIAIDHGEATFDYVGSKDHMTYLALGERVTLVHQLAQLPLEKPILLTASANFWANGMLQERDGQRKGEVLEPRQVEIPGHTGKYTVFYLEPENIATQARSAIAST
jgi:class 3 adenylate cyclase